MAEGRATEREAKHGKKMIEVRVRFFTDAIAEKPGHVVPRHCWDVGVVRFAANPAHNLPGGEPIPFNSLMELPGKIEQAFLKSKITLHMSNKSGKYYSPKKP